MKIFIMLLALITVGTVCRIAFAGDITPAEANEKISTNKDIIILDVRTPAEYLEGHIDGSINIDFRSDNFKTEASKLDKSKKYIIYCRTGIRSANAIKILNGMDIKNTDNMKGGVTAWVGKGLPITQ